MLSFGMFAALAFATASFNLELPSKFAPPSLTATAISFPILVNIFPLLASILPFLACILCHFECPDILIPPNIYVNYSLNFFKYLEITPKYYIIEIFSLQLGSFL